MATRQLVKPIKKKIPIVHKQRPTENLPRYLWPSSPRLRTLRKAPYKSAFTPAPEDRVPLKDRIPYWNITVGDKVQVLVGKDKGKIGLVTDVFKEHNLLRVDGVNYVNESA